MLPLRMSHTTPLSSCTNGFTESRTSSSDRYLEVGRQEAHSWAGTAPGFSVIFLTDSLISSCYTLLPWLLKQKSNSQPDQSYVSSSSLQCSRHFKAVTQRLHLLAHAPEGIASARAVGNSLYQTFSCNYSYLGQRESRSPGSLAGLL